VQSGLEAWRSAYGLRLPRRHEWLSRARDVLSSLSPSGSDETGLVDVDELRDLLAQTRGYKIEVLLAQECAVFLIVRDRSRTDRDVEETLARVAGRNVIDRARIAVVRQRMRASGLVPTVGS
jgi:hypothetical protein